MAEKIKYGYALMDSDSGSTYCILESMDGFADNYKLMKGYSVINEWPADVSFKMDLDYKKQIKLPDCVANPSDVVIVSKRLREFLEQEKVPNVEFLRVTIFNHKGKIASQEYWIANPVTTQDCIDVSKSGITWNDINPDDILFMKQLVLDEKKIDPNAIFFRARHLKTMVFARKDFAKKIEQAVFTGIKFWEVSDYRS